MCLEGISSQDLNYCLDYIYNGELQILQEDLDEFLKVAQRFKHNGLKMNEVKVKIQNNNDFDFQQYDISEPISDDLFENKGEAINTNSGKKIVAVNASNFDLKEETDKYLERLDDRNIVCTVCGRRSPSTAAKKPKLNNMRQNVVKHLYG